MCYHIEYFAGIPPILRLNSPPARDRQNRQETAKQREREMSNANKILFGLVLGLALVVLGIYVYVLASGDESTPAPLTAEQQLVAAKLMTTSPGDIIMIPKGSKYVPGPIVIKEIWAKKNGDFMVSLRPVHAMIVDRMEINELARMGNIDIIRLGSPEWTKVLMDYFVPEARTE